MRALATLAPLAFLALLLAPLAPLGAVAQVAPVARAADGSAWDGTISTGVAACGPAVGCQAAQLPQDQLRSLGAFDGPHHLHAVLTWDATTPLADELRLGASYDTPAGRQHAFVQGQSPLALELPLDIRGELLVWANFPQTLPPAPAWASHEQSFHAEGSVTIR